MVPDMRSRARDRLLPAPGTLPPHPRAGRARLAAPAGTLLRVGHPRWHRTPRGALRRAGRRRAGAVPSASSTGL